MKSLNQSNPKYSEETLEQQSQGDLFGGAQDVKQQCCERKLVLIALADCSEKQGLLVGRVRRATIVVVVDLGFCCSALSSVQVCIMKLAPVFDSTFWCSP